MEPKQAGEFFDSWVKKSYEYCYIEALSQTNTNPTQTRS